MHIHFFFRKPSPEYHSIEKLFLSMIESLPANSARKLFAKYRSKGLINRILIGIWARKNQGPVNHITGDIHFVALFLKKNRTVLTIHDIGILNTGNVLKRKIIRWFWFSLPFKGVGKITVISEFTKNEILKEFSLKPEKIVVIPNCYPSVYHFIEQNHGVQKPVLLQIGTKPNKNLPGLIQAIAGFESKLIIVGHLNEDQLKLLGESAIDYENHVNISENEMLNLFGRCHMLVYISTYEGFGMPVIEANAVGRPVIASNIEPINSVAGNAALLVDPYNTREIHEAIIKLALDEQLRNTLVQNGFENAKRFHPDIIARQYKEVYESILKE
jgi:glycosyltransferase involved in cell wall biosynthesis